MGAWIRLGGPHVNIDVHTHVVPEHFPPVGGRKAGTRWPQMVHGGSGKANVMFEGRNFRTVLDRCWNVGRRITEMPEQGIDKQVLSPMPRLLDYDLDPDDALDLSRYINEDIARMMDEAPDRFYGLGSVPLQDVALSTRELERIKALGLQGVEVQTNIGGKNLGEPQFLPFLKEVERLGLCVFSHAQNPTFNDRMTAAAQNSIGFPVENGLAVAGVITGRVLEECPDLRICFSHGGGVFAQLLPRMQNQWKGGGDLKELLPKSPIEYAQQCYYDDIFFDVRTLRYLIDVVGIRQVMIGSDYPFGGNFRFEVKPDQEFDELGLSQEERVAVGSENCLRFLGITP
jgi:aminocarboxymuconate-semialdehyde decarboxylase